MSGKEFHGSTGSFWEQERWSVSVVDAVSDRTCATTMIVGGSSGTFGTRLPTPSLKGEGG